MQLHVVTIFHNGVFL